MLGSTRYQDTALSVAVQGATAASVIAIDIGVRGAIAFLTTKSELIAVFDMPVLADGLDGRRAVNAPLLAEIVFKSQATQAFIEFVGARPGEGAVGAFAFGRSRGVCEGVLGAAGIPAQHIAPAAWKRTVGIKPGREGAKDAARADAIRRWPSHASLFARVKDDGRAEAALIGVAGRWPHEKQGGEPMIATLISGSLVEAPELRQSKDGHAVAFAFIRARVGKNLTETWQVHVHDRAAQVTLMPLNAGAFVAVQGVPNARVSSLNGPPVLQHLLFAETVAPLKPEGGEDGPL